MTVQNGLKSHNLKLAEALDIAQNCSFQRLLATFRTTHSSDASCQANSDD